MVILFCILPIVFVSLGALFHCLRAECLFLYNKLKKIAYNVIVAVLVIEKFLLTF